MSQGRKANYQRTKNMGPKVSQTFWNNLPKANLATLLVINLYQ